MTNSSYGFVRDFNLYKIGAWNANGWISITQQENINFKESVLKSMDLDFYILSETHCFKDQTLSIEGFKIVQFNRQKVSERAIKGSGGGCNSNK